MKKLIFNPLSGQFDYIDTNKYKTIEFNTAYTPNGEPVGAMYWNSDRDTLELLTGSGEVQVGEDLFFHCINQSGSTIPKGTAVMYAGSLGASGKMKVLPAVADGSVSSIVILGVAKQDILNGEEGKVLCWGQLSGFNTSVFGADKILYIDPANAGGYTITEPQAPNLKYPIAATLDDKNNGNIAVRAVFTPNLTELNDVQITNVQNGEALVWNDANGRWENGTIDLESAIIESKRYSLFLS